nr:MAG TPA: hypothetical protein [Caudoviricetes sp.]
MPYLLWLIGLTFAMLSPLPVASYAFLSKKQLLSEYWIVAIILLLHYLINYINKITDHIILTNYRFKF